MDKVGSYSPTDLLRLLAGGMSLHLQGYPADASISRLATTLVGMANSEGGTLVIGVAPRSGTIQGVGNPLDVQDRILQAALLSDPPLVLPLPRIERIGGETVVVANVPPGLPHVYSLDGRYLWREGSQTNPIPARHLRRLLLERGVVQFESLVPPGASLSDLDPIKVQDYYEALELPEAYDLERSWELLVRRGCLKRTRNQLAPTFAALLLFGRYPQQWVPSATILAVRFSGATFADHFYKQEISGTLPEQLLQAEAFVRQSLKTVVRMVGLARKETPEYPPEAVRELLVNAVAHRDYNHQGDTIHLNLFADRIEVHSPGGLPGPVNLDNLLEARFSRNAVIVQVLSDLGFVERLGYGLDRVVRVMRQNDLRPPQFEEAAGTFRVILYGVETEEKPKALPDLSRYQDLDLNPRQQQVLAYLASHRRIGSRDYQELCPEVHPETLRRDLADLVSRDILIKVGDKRATYYILK